MTAPIAQKKATVLIKSLNEMLFTGVDDGRLKEIEDEAHKIKSYGMAADAYNVLGMISALRMDIHEMDRYFDAALKCTGRDIETLMNYAVALSNANQYCRAIEIVDEVIALEPGDLGKIKESIGLHTNAFDVDGVQRLIEKLSLLGEGVNEPDLINQLSAYKATFSAVDTTWGLVANRIGVAASAIATVTKRPSAESVIHDGVVLFRFLIEASVDEACKAESAMIDALANEPFNSADRAIYFSCAVA